MSAANINAAMAAYFGIDGKGNGDSGNVKDRLVRVALSFSSKYHPNALCVFLFGSSLNRDWRSFSDIDLLVVEEFSELNCTRRYVYDGFPIEAHVFSKEALLRGLRNAQKSGRTNVTLALADGQVISDTGKIATGFKGFAADLVASGPNPMQWADFNLIFRSVILGIKDLSTNPSVDERFTEIVVLQPLMMNLYFAGRGEWTKGGKWAVRDAPAFAKRLNHELQSAVATRQTAGLLAIATELASHWKKPSWDGAHESAIRFRSLR